MKSHNLCVVAEELARFLKELHSIPTDGAPTPSPDNFYRGGPLQIYDAETRSAIDILSSQIDPVAALQVWDKALASEWRDKPLWVHGDMSASNLIARDGHLCGILDFGAMAVGDPACDLTIAWTYFSGPSCKAFCSSLQFDEETWQRARGWTLWKALLRKDIPLVTNILDVPKSST